MGQVECSHLSDTCKHAGTMKLVSPCRAVYVLARAHLLPASAARSWALRPSSRAAVRGPSMLLPLSLTAPPAAVTPSCRHRQLGSTACIDWLLPT